MARIAIIGPGAIGCTIAAWLGRDGRHEVVLCARTPLSGLTVETPEGLLSTHPEVLTDPAAAGPVDWILVATKTYDAAGAARWLPGLGARGAPVAILQNGVEHRERFAAASVDPARVVPVIVDLPAERLGPGRVLQRRRGRMTVGEDGFGPDFVRLFEGLPLDVTAAADFRGVAWRKLCVNAAGVLNALLLKPAGVFRDDAVAEVARQIVREVVAVGRAEGVTLGDDLPDLVVDGCRSQDPASVNSIHADRAAGRPMELDARNGVIVRLGRKHGIPTPCNQMAVALLSA